MQELHQQIFLKSVKCSLSLKSVTGCKKIFEFRFTHPRCVNFDGVRVGSILIVSTLIIVQCEAQCPRMDLNKQSVPLENTTTGSKGTPKGFKKAKK